MNQFFIMFSRICIVYFDLLETLIVVKNFPGSDEITDIWASEIMFHDLNVYRGFPYKDDKEGSAQNTFATMTVRGKQKNRLKMLLLLYFTFVIRPTFSFLTGSGSSFRFPA